MTTTVLVHNSHRSVCVITEDKVWDADNNIHIDRWSETDRQYIAAGQLHQTYCTETRRIVVVEL